jgi:hypothetical protein
MRRALAAVLWLALPAAARAETYSVTLTPEQDTMLAVILEGSSASPQKYLTDALGAHLRSDYTKAAGAISSRIVEKWPTMNAGQRAAVCAAAGISPCVPTKGEVTK